MTSVGSSEILIYPLVPATTSAEPYCKNLIDKLFPRQTLTLSDIPSVSYSNLMTIVASYFSMNMGSAEREMEELLLLFARRFLPLKTAVCELC